ncbi:FAD binding domain-containing protein [Mycobacteroides abscessus]|uniref:FAD binding domain-containing protein n=1 Tax=Mycobacteroides abscessus TaxID=36809 RepID=UPI002102494A|nr:xanthine dehydrogenase family protein subunit M [Mycobacteroides abscessus]
MKPFSFQRASTVQEAVRLASAEGARYYAGGTNLLDLMKHGVAEPATVVDVRRIGTQEITATDDGGVLIGGAATNSAVANHYFIRSRYPVLSQAILSGATTQLRNMATAGGNLMQRTRCPYYMEPSFAACNKRRPGSGCAALEGFNREHAIFGASDSCVAVHPSDMAVALSILDALVHVESASDGRSIPYAHFHRLPDNEPQRDNSTRPGELITGIELSPYRHYTHSWYLKIRDRHSYAFALVSVAVGLTLAEGEIRTAAIALGGVAAMPWRVPEAEAALVGTRGDMADLRTAAELALEGAVPLSQNRFKIDLSKQAVVRSLQRALAR